MRNAESLTGIKPVDVVSLGNTDARLWRYRNVPAVIYGPPTWFGQQERERANRGRPKRDQMPRANGV